MYIYIYICTWPKRVCHCFRLSIDRFAIEDKPFRPNTTWTAGGGWRGAGGGRHGLGAWVPLGCASSSSSSSSLMPPPPPPPLTPPPPPLPSPPETRSVWMGTRGICEIFGFVRLPLAAYARDDFACTRTHTYAIIFIGSARRRKKLYVRPPELHDLPSLGGGHEPETNGSAAFETALSEYTRVHNLGGKFCSS